MIPYTHIVAVRHTCVLYCQRCHQEQRPQPGMTVRQYPRAARSFLKYHRMFRKEKP